MTIQVAVNIENDAGVLRTLKLPAKREVCHRCEGEGTILNPSIGEHAYSAEEFDEAFEPGSEEREHYFKRGGMYDVRCPECEGDRVVAVLDREEMKDRPRRRLGRSVAGKSRARLLKRIDRAARADAEFASRCESERRYGC
jgi:hypothetical protein